MAIVNTSDGFNVERRDMKAEAMLMHRERYVIAVRAAQGDAASVIQVSCSVRNSRVFVSRDEREN